MIKHAMIVSLAALALAGCTDQKQELHSNANYQQAYKGTGSKFVQPGWTPGDRNSWEQELKVRTQQGQNEYNKTAH
ncbi:lipoprotein [Pigmentiphaga litoralis]|jgi:serine protease inhibitor ecotin|uniref:hypothetical protein n=1 Tax=Pigmentiphaga litoralis TaxID=516702 RepID=UPI0016759A0F|nr:hypothetical protein [Pigmentiphaga litoralis]GGX16075.1 lipoprotein [Pigmentiphaga litoralis]